MQKRFTYALLFVSLVFNAGLVYLLLSPTQADAPTEVESAQEKKEKIVESASHKNGESYPFMRVVDGDTVVVGFNGVTQYVRLIGINAPEPNDPGGPQCYANEATAYLQEIARSGIVVLHFDKSQGVRDTYGRLLAYVELPDGTDLGKQMIEDGYAHEFTYDTAYERQEAYKLAESRAIENERGLWSDAVCN